MNPTKKVAFYTLGCKLNFSETSTIARSFKDEGFERVDFKDEADIYVINTCSVTENADKRFKTIVKQAQKVNPEAFVERFREINAYVKKPLRQSNVFNLLQPPVEQPPLLLQPLGFPPSSVEQDVQDIFYFWYQGSGVRCQIQAFFA